MAFEKFDVEFTKEGKVFDEGQVQRLLAALDPVADLLVMSHGWNNDMKDARRLYDDLDASLDRLLKDRALADRRIAAVRIFWPSKRFTDQELMPGGGAAVAVDENDAALMQVLDALKRDPWRLGDTQVDPGRESIVLQAQALVPRLDDEADGEARSEFVRLLRSLLDRGARDGDDDDGSAAFFDDDPGQIFESLQDMVPAPAADGVGGATSMGDAGGAAFFGDLLSGAKAAARRIANFATYYQMKQRAGTVGRTGLAPLLRRLRDRNPGVRLHLVGHSFGGRLVTAAADALPDGMPAVTMTLLQAAYSHNGLSEDYDGEGHPGAFRGVLAGKRVSGPIVITHTKDDRAVGIAYPLASRISRDPASSIGTRDDPYGGMGRNGAQHMSDGECVNDDLRGTGHAYGFSPGLVYNLNADGIIRDHGDVTGEEVAHLILSVAGVA